VEVEWEDAISIGKWMDDFASIKPPTCVTRGWLVHETTDFIILAGTISEAADYGEIICLPIGMIVNIYPLSVSYKGELNFDA
jgi:hypothetical protein